VVFRSNSVSSPGKSVGGGAISVGQSSAVLVATGATDFIGNTAVGSSPLGGALYIQDSPKEVRLQNPTFESNAVHPSSGCGYGGTPSPSLSHFHSSSRIPLPAYTPLAHG
jgi:hypothetical protein